MTRLAVLLAIAGAATAQTGALLTLQISSETAPPGGYAQFKLQANPDGYRYSRFCELYQRWRSKLDVVLRQGAV